MKVARYWGVIVLLVGGTSAAIAQTPAFPLGPSATASAPRIVLHWSARRTLPGPKHSPVASVTFAGMQNLQRAEVIVGRGITIEWDAPSIGLPLTHYMFEAGRSPGATDTAVLVLPADRTSFTFNASAEGTYHFRLRAVNEFGTSEPSEEVMLVVCSSACAEAPGPITQLTFQVSGRQVSLAWQAPQPASIVSEYLVEVGTSSGLANLGTFVTGNSTASVTIDDVPSGTYYIRVRANSLRILGAPSNEVVVAVP